MKNGRISCEFADPAVSDIISGIFHPVYNREQLIADQDNF